MRLSKVRYLCVLVMGLSIVILSPLIHEQVMASTKLLVDGQGLLQFTSGGHVLGFGRSEMYIASVNHVLKVEFVGAQGADPKVKEATSSKAAMSKIAQPLGAVTYTGLWEGVSVVYEGQPGAVLKSTYRLSPGEGRFKNIRLRYNVPVRLAANGGLAFKFDAGELIESRPVAWQEINGQRVPVEVSFRILGQNEAGFELGEYSPIYPLIIDPTLTWNTFLGSAGDESAYYIALDAAGNIYVTGHGGETWGSPINPHAGAVDCFVAKLDNSGVLQWHTFLGSSDDDWAWSIAVDTAGNIYVAGISDATWGSPIDPYTGGRDIFVAKLNNSGVLQWNTFWGSANFDAAYCLSLDAAGNIYVGGVSEGNWGAPINPHTGGRDIFVAKVNNSGILQWHTFLGSANEDLANELSLDAAGNIYVTGRSFNTWGVPINPYNNSADIFVAKLNSSGVLQWNTFLGSSAIDEGLGLKLDVAGNIYVAGRSNGNWGAPISPYTGGEDIFVAKLNNSGVLQWNTFLGSANMDLANDLAMDAAGNIYVAGYSIGTWGNPINPYNGNEDIFLARLNNNGVLQWNTFLGSTGKDMGYCIALDSNNNVYLSGNSSASWGVPINPHAGGEFEAVVAKIEIAKKAFVDVKPGSCPNPLNVKSKGVLPVAVLGDVDFDVTQINPESIRLVGVAPLRYGFEDVATPYIDYEILNAYDCLDWGADGYLDLTLKFDTQDIVEALGEVNDGQEVVLTLTGELLDGTPITGKDIVIIKKKNEGKKK